MFISREIERYYEVTGGIDGAYDDPSDAAMVIVCKDGIVSRFPKDLFDHPNLNQKPKVKNNNREAKIKPRNNEPWQGKGKRKKPKTTHKKNK